MADSGTQGPFTASTPSGSASQADILQALKNQVIATTALAQQYTQQTPDFTSGQITASVFGTLVQSGFVRLLGISIITGTTNGGLYDSATNNPTAGQQVGALLATPGWYATQMIFTNGMVAKPSTGQIVSLHYARS
jgi:hypothetical protein